MSPVPATVAYPLEPAPDDRPAPPDPGTVGWLRHIPYVIVLVSLFFNVVNTFIGDTFYCRSSSMEPTMVGHLAGGDRVAVARSIYAFQEPERFDIVSFLYPNNLDTNYMKRLVGLPGEQLFISGGDLWLADAAWAGSLEAGLLAGRATILRKPLPLQEELWDGFPVILPADLEDQARMFPLHFEVTQGDAGAWKPEEDHIAVTASAPALAATKREIRDTLFDFASIRDSGLPESSGVGGQHPVGDLSFRVAVRPESGPGAAVLVIRDAVHDLEIRAEAAVEGSPEPTRLLIGGRVAGTSLRTLDTGSWTDVRLDNADDRVRLLFDGDEVLVRDYGHAPSADDRKFPWRRPAAAFGATAGAFKMRVDGLYRDLFWTGEGQTRFLIPAGHYVVLGDNSPQSSDSRAWKRTAIEVFATGEILEGDLHGVTNEDLLLHDNNPWSEVDGTKTFIDLRGQFRTFASGDAYRVLGTWSTPYVPRERIRGRAMFLAAAPWSRLKCFR